MSVERAQARDPLAPQLLAGVRVEHEDVLGVERRLAVAPDDLARAVAALLAAGGHFVGVFAAEQRSALRALVAYRGELIVLRARLGDARAYRSLAMVSAAAELPERELHDETGIVPLGHPRLEPALRPDPDRIERRVTGPETFVIPYGPIRSGVFEAIQYPIDTGGEDVLALTVRPYFKRRGLERRLAGLGVDEGAYVAERVAGPASVAHALAFALAVERVAGVEVPERAERWRIVHAELERIANHLDVATKLAEDAALAVGVARFGTLKEQVMRLRARLCGSRFGRGVVVAGGIRAEPLAAASEVVAALDAFEPDFDRDRDLLLRTTSLTDRLIGTGALDAETISRFGGVGPVARACSLGVDARLERPYGSYPRLGFGIARSLAGDAMARFDVRLQEVDRSLHLIRQALEHLDRLGSELRRPLPAAAEGEGCGWSEAPMGELVYWLVLEGTAVREAHVVSPSLRNWPLLSESYRGDVLTDVSFIEHSFGLTPAGADR